MIPSQLKDMQFLRVAYKTKKPFERGWTNKPYSYKKISKYFPKENYGVMTGINGLGVLDDDSENKELLNLALKSFGETFRVRDHLYFKIKDWDGNKIIFYDKSGKHYGELQGKGQMVVGAGSVHPSGEIYEIKNNIPIKEIDFEIFKGVFEKYLDNHLQKEIKRNYTPIQTSSNNFLDKLKSAISMESVLRHFGVNTSMNPTNCIFHFCSHRCLSFNSEVCNCFDTDCGQGYNIFSFVQKAKGLSSADTIKWLSEFAGMQKEYEEAKQEYLNQNKKPMGWACSINIKKMAERYNLLNCPTCNVPYSFNEILGQFKCSKCGDFGGLKTFAVLCYRNKSIGVAQ
jgi:hypothetical protein